MYTFLDIKYDNSYLMTKKSDTTSPTPDIGNEFEMSHEERNTVAALLSGILVNIYVIIKLRRMFDDGRLAGDDAVQVWAQAMLWVIPVGIALVIISTILFNILYAIATNTENPSFLTDERDHAISGFGMKVTLIVTSIGFIGLIIALAMGTEVLTALIGMWFAFAAGSLVGDLSKNRAKTRGNFSLRVFPG